MNKEKTKRRKEPLLDKQSKANLWNVFDNEVNGGPSEPLECIYRASGDRENCEECQANLAFSEANMMSAIIASSRPPPKAIPLTAAMRGFLNLGTTLNHTLSK